MDAVSTRREPVWFPTSTQSTLGSPILPKPNPNPNTNPNPTHAYSSY